MSPNLSHQTIISIFFIVIIIILIITEHCHNICHLWFVLLLSSRCEFFVSAMSPMCGHRIPAAACIFVHIDDSDLEIMQLSRISGVRLLTCFCLFVVMSPSFPPICIRGLHRLFSGPKCCRRDFVNHQ